jgi:hypothetical protein
MTIKEHHKQDEALAFEIAHMFGELEDLDKFAIYCCKYPRWIIKKAYQNAKTIPPERIKKSRGAVFFYLVKQYAHTSPYNPRRRSRH